MRVLFDQIQPRALLAKNACWLVDFVRSILNRFNLPYTDPLKAWFLDVFF